MRGWVSARVIEAGRECWFLCPLGKSKDRTADAAKKKAELEKRLQVSDYLYLVTECIFGGLLSGCQWEAEWRQASQVTRREWWKGDA